MTILKSITKGNFNLEQTKKYYKHENNLRFHFLIEDRFYEYSIDTFNKSTINMQCVVRKQDHIKKGHHIQRPRCYGRITLIVGGRLKTQQKSCNSKKPKYEWSDENVFDDYLDVRNYAIQKHVCKNSCKKGCILKHNCGGHEYSRDRKRTYTEVARNHNLKNPSLEPEKSMSRAEEKAFPVEEFEGESVYHGISESHMTKRLNADTMTWLDSMREKPWEYRFIMHDGPPKQVKKEKFCHEYDDGMKIFCIPSQLNLFKRFKAYGDGTFRTINSLFHPNTKKKMYCQNFIITIKWTMDEYIFCYPVIYGLMPRRRKADYVKFWQRVNAIFEQEFPGEQMDFISYSTDFESASFKDFSKFFLAQQSFYVAYFI